MVSKLDLLLMVTVAFSSKTIIADREPLVASCESALAPKSIEDYRHLSFL